MTIFAKIKTTNLYLYMKNLFYLLVMLFMPPVLQVSAANLSVHFPDITLHPGETGEMIVSYTTDYDNLGAFEAKFTLPDGIQLVDAKISNEVSKACPNFYVSFSDHIPGSNISAVLCYPDGGFLENLPSGTHDLLVLTFKADLNLKADKYVVHTSDVAFSNWNYETIPVDNPTFSITCEGEPAPESNALVLWHADGTTTFVSLNLMPRVEFVGDKLSITSSVLDMEYPRTDILRFTYKYNKGDIHVGIGQTARESVDYRRDGDRLVFKGISSADNVAVFSSDGKQVPAMITESAEGVTLSLSSILKGVYILSVNGKSVKFTRP